MPKGRRKTLKGPRAWRKIDISDIKDAAQQRTEDVLAGGKVEDKSSDMLFTVTKKKATRTSLSPSFEFWSWSAFPFLPTILLVLPPCL